MDNGEARYLIHMGLINTNMNISADQQHHFPPLTFNVSACGVGDGREHMHTARHYTPEPIGRPEKTSQILRAKCLARTLTSHENCTNGASNTVMKL
jgi:hypothetical protein